MEQQTIYISDDGRRFDLPEECEEWEKLLVLIREIRERLWDAGIRELKEACSYGPVWIRENIGEGCTDESDLNRLRMYFGAGNDALEAVSDVFGPPVTALSPDEIKEFLNRHSKINDLLVGPLQC